MRQEGKAQKDFAESEEAMQQYYNLTLGPPPKLSDFYQPSDAQKKGEITFIIVGMTTVYFLAKYLNKKLQHK